jgi:hypothetical protein
MNKVARNAVETVRLAVWSIMLLVGVFLGALIMVGIVLAVLVFLLLAL